MSWSVAAFGKAPAVAAKLAVDFEIKNNIASAVSAALAAFPPDGVVEVSASGSQSHMSDEHRSNQLAVSIKPVWGFLE